MKRIKPSFSLLVWSIIFFSQHFTFIFCRGLFCCCEGYLVLGSVCFSHDKLCSSSSSSSAKYTFLKKTSDFSNFSLRNSSYSRIPLIFKHLLSKNVRTNVHLLRRQLVLDLIELGLENLNESSVKLWIYFNNESQWVSCCSIPINE